MPQAEPRRPNSPLWKVHKFGGTSVLNATRYRSVHKILTEIADAADGPIMVVVSAMKGTTDDLIRSVALAAGRDEGFRDLLAQIEERHRREVSELLLPPQREDLLKIIAADIREVTEILRGVWLVKRASEDVVDLVSGLGEVWSAQILNSFIQQEGAAWGSERVKARPSRRSEWLDTRKVLVVAHENRRVEVNWDSSKEKLASWLDERRKEHGLNMVVATGFVASTSDGTATTLGRNGSDYSASILGALLPCEEIVIWTDVDGIFSSDPRQVPEAVILDEMSYSEVTELAYFGAKVVHPSTMAPAIAKQIPIWIKNSLNPRARGTKVHKDATSDRAVKGFSTIDGIALLNVEGTGMAGVPGVAETLFASLRRSGVSAVLISQASSEQSICFAVPDAQGEAAKRAAEEAFYAEIQKGLIQGVQVQRGLSILAAVGDNMAMKPGVSGKFFSALGACGVNVRAIAQGSSERNISAVIDTRDSIKALRTVHSAFILPNQTFSIGLIGTGLIGSTFLRQLGEKAPELGQTRNVHFQVRALANSRRMLLSETPISPDKWRERFESESQPLDLKLLTNHIQPTHIPHALIIEATASAELTPQYKEWLARGLHIISPNKKANSGPMRDYVDIRQAAHVAGRHFLYSTNVGAGLPILQTLRDLRSTGDDILTIEGILSGTLSFLFNHYDGTQPFSRILRSAMDQGYTEPDPRDDLSGADVARKLIILAREAGLHLEMSDVHLEGLVPENLRDVSRDEFLKRLAELDEPMSARFSASQSNRQILRYVATVALSSSARVGLESVPESHPFSRVSGTDNIVLFKTKRYFHQPLIVQGPGAGPEVTAGGVFADVLRLSQYVGAIL